MWLSRISVWFCHLALMPSHDLRASDARSIDETLGSSSPRGLRAPARSARQPDRRPARALRDSRAHLRARALDPAGRARLRPLLRATGVRLGAAGAVRRPDVAPEGDARLLAVAGRD